MKEITIDLVIIIIIYSYKANNIGVECFPIVLVADLAYDLISSKMSKFMYSLYNLHLFLPSGNHLTWLLIIIVCKSLQFCIIS